MKRDRVETIDRDTPLTVGMLMDLLEDSRDTGAVLEKLREMVEGSDESEAREMEAFEKRHF